MAPARLVYVVGAGIAGLTLALALAKFGMRVTVLEREAEIASTGAGIQISPNARRILDRLGLDRTLATEAFAPIGIDIWPQGSRRPIRTLPLGAAVTERFGAPYTVMHRADLARALLAATRRFANIEIVTGVSEISWVPQPAGVRVRYRQPASAPVSGPAFALLGADGVNSALRQTLPEMAPAGETGALAWRSLAAPDALGNGLLLDRTTVLLAPGHHMVIYPLPARERVNLVLLDTRRTRGPEVAPSPSSHPVMATLLRRIPDWTPWSIRTHARHHFGHGPVALVGDAAHAMLPFAAQGAAMGIEDAATLATLLATAPRADHAITRYAALRADRVQKVAELSRRNGEIFHFGWPAATARNAAIRFGPATAHLERLAWVYDYEIAGGTAILGGQS